MVISCHLPFSHFKGDTDWTVQVSIPNDSGNSTLNLNLSLYSISAGAFSIGIILKIKSCDSLNESHIGQCINYLKVSKNKLAILINFSKGHEIEYKRIVL